MNDEAIINMYQGLDERGRFALLEEHIEQGEISDSFLINVLTTEQSHRMLWLAIKGLGTVKSTAATPYLIQICKKPDQDFDHTSLHAICAWSLGRIGVTAISHVMPLLNERNAETRRCAVDALGEIRDPVAIDKLADSLKEDEYKIQLWAGLSLAKIGDQSLPHLHHIFSQCHNKTKLIALDAILKIGSDESLPLIRDSLKHGSDEEKRLILTNGVKHHKLLLPELQLLADADNGDISELAYLVLRPSK